MDVDELVQGLEGAIGRLPSDTQQSRRSLYARVRRTLEASCQSPDGSVDRRALGLLEKRLQAAIAIVEQAYVDDEGAFQLPSDEPTTRSGYIWLRVVGAAGAIGGLVDFIKPIVSVQSALFFVCVIGAIACHAAIRVVPGWRRLLAWGRRAGAALAAVLLVLFGVQTAIPGASDNGVIAEAIPPLQQIQQQLLGEIRQTIASIDTRTKDIDVTTRNTDKTVSHIDARTQSMAGDLAEIAKDSDPVESAKGEIVRAGYSLDADGYLKAILDNDGMQFAFGEIGVELTKEAIARSVGAAPWNKEQIATFGQYIQTTGGSLPKQLRLEYADFKAAASGENSTADLTAFHARMCSAGPVAGIFEEFLELQLKPMCSDSARWYGGARNILHAMDSDFTSANFKPTQADEITMAEFYKLNRSRAARFVRMRTEVRFNSQGGIIIGRTPPGTLMVEFDSLSDVAATAAIEKCLQASSAGKCSGMAYYFHEEDNTQPVAVADFRPL